MSRPTVTVVITTKNRSAIVSDAINSALGVEHDDFDLEVLVVDDGSTDDTPAVLAAHPVRVVRTEGIGMAPARNLGMQQATGEFVTLLDDDDVLLPAALGTQLRVFAEHPEYGSVHGQAQLTDMDGTPFNEPIPVWPRPSGWIFEDVLTYFPQIGTMLTRATAIADVGGMDGSLTGDTDWDWVLRIARRHPIGRVPVPVVLFRQRGDIAETMSWRRYPAMVTIFKRQTAALAPVTRLRLRPILWRHRGWWSGNFLDYARRNWRDGNRRRAFTSLWYAFRASPPHLAVGLVRLPFEHG